MARMCLSVLTNWEEVLMHRYFFLILVCFFCNLFVFAQESPPVLKEIKTDSVAPAKTYKYWVKEYYDSIPRIEYLSSSAQPFQKMISKYQHKDFEYVESISDKLTIWRSIVRWLHNFLSDLFPNINLRPGDWFYTVLGVAGAGLVIFLLYKFFLSGKQFIRNPKEEASHDEDSIEFVERNLLDVDINTYIKEALNEKNYALAVRYQQLLNIQLLAKKNYIVWNQAKTNIELMAEIPNADLKEEFKKCTELFNYVWFGDFTLSTPKFEAITNQFKEFQRRWS